MKTVAVILAGGSGTRLGSSTPKQYLIVEDKMVIEHTINVFQNHNMIDEIAIVSAPNFTQLLNDSVIKNHYTKVKHIIKGGKERHHSSLSAISAYETHEELKILFHDAVRPLVSDQMISDCISTLDQYNAVGVGIMTTDTIWQTKEGVITNIPNRQNIYRAQTPQGFKFSTIKNAYKIAINDKNLIATDDCGIVSHYLRDEAIAIVEGHEKNIKITRKEDLVVFKNTLNDR